MRTMSGQDHIDIVTSVTRIETILEMLQHDQEELSIRLENHMIEETLERKDTMRRINNINLLLVVILLLSGSDIAIPAFKLLVG